MMQDTRYKIQDINKFEILISKLETNPNFQIS